MLPELTLFITAYNEEDVVDDKMRNSLSLDYPEEICEGQSQVNQGSMMGLSYAKRSSEEN